MSYVNGRRKRRKKSGLAGLLGLDGVENCGTNQVWDPNIEFYGVKGQCMPRANYRPDQLENPNAIPGVVKTAGASSGGGSDWTKLLGGLLANATRPTTPQQPIVYQPSSGMSTGTLVALGALGLGLLYVATK